MLKGNSALGVAGQIDEVSVVPPWRWDQALPDLAFSAETESGGGAQRRAEESHPFSGAGKLLLAVTMAEFGARIPNLLSEYIPVRRSHRNAARTGSLRWLSGDLRLSIDDALNLVLSSGDGASALALLEFLERQEVDLVEGARSIVDRTGLDSTRVFGAEGSDESWGEGLVGTTTPRDLSVLLTRAYTAGAGSSAVHASGIDAEISRRVLGWMDSVFEPAGLASALPGYGPNRVRHWTLSGWESVPAGAKEGSTSVLIAQSSHAGWFCVAAHHPAWEKAAGTASPRDVSAAFGTLGLSAYFHGNL